MQYSTLILTTLAFFGAAVQGVAVAEPLPGLVDARDTIGGCCCMGLNNVCACLYGANAGPNGCEARCGSLCT